VGTATVTAAVPTVTLFLPRAGFEELSHSHPALVGAAYALATSREEHLRQVAAGEVTPADDYLL
jgi:hypothetical protein